MSTGESRPAGEDSELEMLKAKRLAEMRRNMSSASPAGTGTQGKGDPKNPDLRELLVGILGYRGEEVLHNAESQFPYQTRVVVQKLGELILSGELAEHIDGGKLLALFRSVGVNVRMDTKIHVEKDGKMISLSDKLGIERRKDGGSVDPV